MIKKTLLALALFVISYATASATPSSAIIMSDRLVGVTKESYFVIRTTLFNYPTYYQSARKAEFIELSIATNKIKSRCTLRKTDYLSDADPHNEKWKITEAKIDLCSPYQILSEKNAAYIEPESIGEKSFSFRMDAKGLMVKNNYDENDQKWHQVLPKEMIELLAKRTTQIPTKTIPWQTGNDNSETETILESFDECKLNPVPIEATFRVNRSVFFRFNCWLGNGDNDGANFYIPVDSKLWLKE